VVDRTRNLSFCGGLLGATKGRMGETRSSDLKLTTAGDVDDFSSLVGHRMGADRTPANTERSRPNSVVL
jgi:hypothetical protein